MARLNRHHLRRHFVTLTACFIATSVGAQEIESDAAASITLLGTFRPPAISAGGDRAIGLKGWQAVFTETDTELIGWSRTGAPVSLGKKAIQAIAVTDSDLRFMSAAITDDGKFCIAGFQGLGEETALIWTSRAGLRSITPPADSTIFIVTVSDVTPDGAAVGNVTLHSAGDSQMTMYRLRPGGSMELLGEWDAMPRRDWPDRPAPDAGLPQPIAVSPDGEFVVGWVAGGETMRAFLWSSREGTIDLGQISDQPTHNEARVISDDGRIVAGNSSDTTVRLAPDGQVFIWTRGRGMVGIGDLLGGQFRSRVSAMSGDGTVIFGEGTTDTGPRAFVWTAMHGLRDLNNVLSEEFGIKETHGWHVVQVVDASMDGRILLGRAVLGSIPRDQACIVQLDRPWE